MNSFHSKYKVLQKIGEGSFSEVLKCENRTTGVYYAAKRLKKAYKTENNVMACAEIVAAQKVPYHVHLLNMLEYHYDSFTGNVNFVFELMDMSMHDYLQTKRKGLSEHRARSYLYQILSGLEHLHDHGLFHRDVKPENILIRFPSILYTPITEANTNEIIKIADLGSVRGIFSEPPYTEYISTRWYRSPECLLTVGNYGPKMDVWAAGCVFYEMLTLKPLFPGNNEIDQLCKIHKVLGAPSIHYLSKLKSRSQNCILFPKAKGSGLDILLPFITKTGKHILRLMLEYDSEKRVTIKRLLKHCYFDEIRRKGDKRAATKSHIRAGRGDEGSLPNIYPMVKKYFIKENYSGEAKKSIESTPNRLTIKGLQGKGDVKGSKGSGKSHKSSKSNKSSNMKATTLPSVEIPYYQYNNKSTFSSLPIVDYKVENILCKRPNHVFSEVKPIDPKKEAAVYKRSKSSYENRKKRDHEKKFCSKSFVCAK